VFQLDALWRALAQSPTEHATLAPRGTRGPGPWGPRELADATRVVPARAIDPKSGSPLVGRKRPPARTDSPPVMPETRCVSKK